MFGIELNAACKRVINIGLRLLVNCEQPNHTSTKINKRSVDWMDVWETIDKARKSQA